MTRSQFFAFVACFAAFSTPLSPSHAKQITTNSIEMGNAPDWLTQSRVEKITDRIQYKLEWTTRKTPVYWYFNEADYVRAQSLGPLAMAVTEIRGDTAKVHLGPLVTNAEFDAVFGHELVHVIVGQKYKDSIPKWLEEGLANHLAKRGTVDYKWLAKQDLPSDVLQLAHPFNGSAASIGMRYRASQALAELLDKKCGLDNLIRLSVQRKMENYIQTYCDIKDLNVAFRDWVKKKATTAN